MRSGVLLFVILLFSFSVEAQYWMQFGGSITIDEGMDVDADAADNSYTTGYFTTTANFTALSVTSSGIDDIFIYKTNGSGVGQWLKKAGGSGSDKAFSIDADNLGNTVITGYFNNTAQFDAQSVTSAGQQDIFVAKYDAAGNLVWVMKAGGTGNDAGYGVTFDRSGNVIVTGEFSGTCTFGSFTLTSAAGTADVFTAKYNPSGTVLWAKKGSGPLADKGTDVVADSLGNIYVSGLCSDTVTFDFTHNNSFNNAIFLIRYNAAGQEQWFRWMGSSTTAEPGGMDLNGGAITLTGDLTGSLFFFGGVGFPSLPTTQAFNIFLCRYDTSGNYRWSRAEGSSSEVESRAIAMRRNGNSVIAGNFMCRFNDYSAAYGDGIFCSVGYWDSYVSSYDSSGNRLWARHYGGKRDDFAYGMALRNDSLAVVTGSFEDRLVSTNNPAGFLGYGISQINGSGFYCADNNYNKYVAKSSAGNKDIYVNNNIDLTREPFDYFYRGSGCDRPFNDACVALNQVASLVPCEDTVTSCAPSTLYANTYTAVSREPNWTYQWSTGSPLNQATANSSGTYWVIITSEDGCFSTTDSVYFDLQPFPPDPLISDSKGVNINSSGPLPILLCYPDSVELTCTNAGSNTVSWVGFPIGQNPVMVNSSGTYTCTLTNASGCSKATGIDVNIYMPMLPISPKLICVDDTLDHNDTIDICIGSSFTMLPYDTVGNPLASLDSCFLDLTQVVWDTATLFTNLAFSTTSNCSPSPQNTFVPFAVGSYDFIFTAMIIRETVCDSDTVIVSRPLHVDVNPVPTISSFPITITSSSSKICPGGTVLLVAHGASSYTWKDGSGATISTDDSVTVTAAGVYSVECDSSITNAWGCTAEVTSGASVQITSYAQPFITANPSTGVACPNDSVQLLCTETGVFNWTGPNGPFGGDDSLVYVTAPGSYYCVLNVAPGCDILTNTIQISPYNNPIIIAFPAPSLCTNNSVTLTVVSNAGSTITWLPPLSGSSATQVVTDTGTYFASVVSCNITTPLSFTVYRDTAVALITSVDPVPVFCAGDSVQLFANIGMAHYEWLPSGDTTTSIYTSQGGVDTLITTSQHGCTDTATITVNELINTVLPPTVSDTSVCAGFPVDLTATGPDTIYWTHSTLYADTFFTGNSIHIPSLTSTVTYYVYTWTGLCKSAFDSVQAVADPCHDIFISNVLTPDKDNLNDLFPGQSGNYLLDLKIFNRWGHMIFETSQNVVGWDGRNKGGQVVPDGTYYYVMDVTFYDNTVQNYKGALMVLHGKD